MSFKQNISARNRFSQLVRGESISPLQLTASEAQDALFGHHYKQPGMTTEADCKKVYHELIYKMGEGDGKGLLARFGIFNINDLFMGSYGSFVEYARKAIDFGLSPDSPWDIDYEFDELRHRWLLTKADFLFEVETLGVAQQCMRNNCNDVTGIEKFEQLFKQQNGGKKWTM